MAERWRPAKEASVTDADLFGGWKPPLPPRTMGTTISVFDARKIASRPPASAGLVPAERQLICYRMTSAPPLSCPLASRVGRRVGEGIFALAGSWSVVIPTGASPSEIGKHRSCFSLIPKWPGFSVEGNHPRESYSCRFENARSSFIMVGLH